MFPTLSAVRGLTVNVWASSVPSGGRNCGGAIRSLPMPLMMLARMRFRFCPLTLRKPVCCGFCAHCGQDRLPCADAVMGTRYTPQRAAANVQTNTPIHERFAIGILLRFGLLAVGCFGRD